MLMRRIGARRLPKSLITRSPTTSGTLKLSSSNNNSSLPILQYSSFYSTASVSTKPTTTNNNNSGPSSSTPRNDEQQANLPKYMSPLKLTTSEAIDEYYMPQLHEPVHSIIERSPRSVFLEYLRTTVNPETMYENMFSKQMILDTSKDKAQMIYYVYFPWNPDISLASAAVGPMYDKTCNTASWSACLQLLARGLLSMDSHSKPVYLIAGHRIYLSSSKEIIDYAQAKQFLSLYCSRFLFNEPEFKVMTYPLVGGRALLKMSLISINGYVLGRGVAEDTDLANKIATLEAVRHLDAVDPALWASLHKKQAPLDYSTTSMDLRLSYSARQQLSEIVYAAENSTLFKNAVSVSINSTPPRERLYKIFSWHTIANLKERNETLMKELTHMSHAPEFKFWRNVKDNLPVYQYADKVRKTVSLNEMCIILASTGSGKTTQIPQIILDEYIKNGNGTRCNIIVTQPRRVAATSVAKRVANERQGIAGDVGYNIRFDAKPVEKLGSISFWTVGIILSIMQKELIRGISNVLDQFSHIIVDEVHERSVNIDVLLCVMKQYIELRRRLNKRPIKIILMSATVDPKPLAEYFQPVIKKKIPVLNLPGRIYPVERHYIEDIIANRNEKLSKEQLLDEKWLWEDKDVEKYINREIHLPLKRHSITSEMNENSDNISITDLYPQTLPTNLAYFLIAHAVATSNSGHILVFLPGMDEIMKIKRKIDESPGTLHGLGDILNTEKYTCHILHSELSTEDKSSVFDPAPPGVRRIILATNIAETSVTVPGVTHVIDSGVHRELRYNGQARCEKLCTTFIGSSNAGQRAGRAGRTESGHYYTMLSRQREEQLQPRQSAEIVRVPLESTVLMTKACGLNSSAKDVLQQMLSPPNPTQVEYAVNSLKASGMLNENEDLSPVGQLVLATGVRIETAKIALFGAIFRCLDQACALAAILDAGNAYMSRKVSTLDKARKNFVEDDFTLRSDFLVMLKLYKKWVSLGETERYTFEKSRELSGKKLTEINMIHSRLKKVLQSTGITSLWKRLEISRREQGQETTSLDVNEMGDNTYLLVALLAYALSPNYAVQVSKKGNLFKGGYGEPCYIDRDSVWSQASLARDQLWDNPAKDRVKMIAFQRKYASEVTTKKGTSFEVFLIRDGTPVDPLVYLLFGARKVKFAGNSILADGWLKVVLTPSARFLDLERIVKLGKLWRDSLNRVVHGILTYGKHNGQGMIWNENEETRNTPESSTGEAETSRLTEIWDDNNSVSRSLSEDGGGEKGERHIIKDDQASIQELEEFAQLTKSIVKLISANQVRE